MDILPGFKLCRKGLHQYPADKQTCPECRKNRNKQIHACALPPGFKQCAKCNKLKSLSSFYKRNKEKNLLRNECKECASKRNKEYVAKHKHRLQIKNKEWAIKNKNKIRDTKIKRKFGITLEEKNQMFKDQQNKCAICGTVENIRGRDWDIDHCHETGKVRGILCSNCNRGLGLFGDSVKNLLKAAEYLQKHK